MKIVNVNSVYIPRHAHFLR